MKTKLVAVTGANGFVGYNLCNFLENSGFKVKRISGSSHSNYENNVSISSWNDPIKWERILADVDYIIHCAGIAHRFNLKENKEIYENSNHRLTRKILFAAKKTNVKKFIFLSTIKVNGDFTLNNQSFKHDDKPNPSDAYGRSKLNAEKSIIQMTKNSNLNFVIVRPALIYGDSVKGNLLRLLNIINTRIPLPLANIRNERSFTSIHNLLDFLLLCLKKDDANNKTFLISDSNTVSTTTLVKLISKGLNKKIILFYLPIYFIKIIGKIANKKFSVNSIISSMKVDIEYSKKELNWSPRITTNKGIIEMVKNWTDMKAEKKK